MSSYRKKHNPQKSSKPVQELKQAESEYQNPGVDRELHTNRLTSGLPYQRPVNQKEVDRLIREWDERLLDPVIVSFRPKQTRMRLTAGDGRIFPRTILRFVLPV